MTKDQKPDSDEEGSLHVTWTNSKGEEERSETPTHRPTFEPSPNRHQSDARSKALHDPLLQTYQRIQETIAPRNLNRLRAKGQRTILDKKQLSTDGVVDKYLEIWDTLKFHNY